ncbi:MAG: alpha/beta fold hydrolase, partial [Chloroflexota bacterium]
VMRIIGTLSPQLGGYVIFKLFSTPLKRNRTEPSLNPSKFTVNYGQRTLVGYEWHGSGQRILLVHGWESSAARFKKLLKLLIEQDYHVFAMDAPAHGFSTGLQTNPLDYADALHTFIRTIGDVDIILAHSLGGAATMNLLARYSNVKPNRVILIGSIDHPQQAVDFFTDVFQLFPDVSKEMTRQMEKFTGGSMDRVSGAKIAQSRQEQALIIHDREDKIVPVEAGRAIADNWHDAIYIETNGLGHRRILNDNTVLAQILDFIRQREAVHSK